MSDKENKKSLQPVINPYIETDRPASVVQTAEKPFLENTQSSIFTPNEPAFPAFISTRAMLLIADLR